METGVLERKKRNKETWEDSEPGGCVEVRGGDLLIRIRNQEKQVSKRWKLRKSTAAHGQKLAVEKRKKKFLVDGL